VSRRCLPSPVAIPAQTVSGSALRYELLEDFKPPGFTLRLSQNKILLNLLCPNLVRSIAGRVL
jgi:hypothetical protein